MPCVAHLWSFKIQPSYDVSTILSYFCWGSWPVSHLRNVYTCDLPDFQDLVAEPIKLVFFQNPAWMDPLMGCDRARAPCTKDAEKLGDLGHPKIFDVDTKADLEINRDLDMYFFNRWI